METIKSYFRTLVAYLASESAKRAYRTFVITTVGLFVPGVLGWLGSLTDWANSNGADPFPALQPLAYLAVSAIAGGVVAAVNLGWNAFEDFTGRALLRDVPRRNSGF